MSLSWAGRGVNSHVNFQNSLSCAIDFSLFPHYPLRETSMTLLSFTWKDTLPRPSYFLKDPVWSNSRANELLYLVKVHGATKNNRTCRSFGELLDHALRRTNL